MFRGWSLKPPTCPQEKPRHQRASGFSRVPRKQGQALGKLRDREKQESTTLNAWRTRGCWKPSTMWPCAPPDPDSPPRAQTVGPGGRKHLWGGRAETGVGVGGFPGPQGFKHWWESPGLSYLRRGCLRVGTLTFPALPRVPSRLHVEAPRYYAVPPSAGLLPTPGDWVGPSRCLPSPQQS